jgi:hypothetical protein
MLRLTFILVTGYLFFSSCQRIDSFADSKLRFSVDTLFFDTVFSSVGSVTKELRIINPGKHNLKIDHVCLAGGSSSRFRLNIDGEPGYEKFNVLIESGDSIFIFIDIFIDPGNETSPVVVNDSIIFSLGEKNQQVNLLAWGQDINLIKKKKINSEIWQKGKPYVIYENVTVDTLETLTIEEGTRIYFHRNASMIIAGSIIVRGSNESPVVFAGDRLEKMYADIPGQWKGILILNSSKGNNISHAVIRNATYGIQLGEPYPGNEMPVLKLFSSFILHSSVSGLSAIKGNIEAANCVITHCGSYCLYIASGGEYNFTNCSLFNSWDYGLRLTPAIYITEKPSTPQVIVSQLDLNMNNSVVFGDNLSELNIVPLNTVLAGNYYFDHCLIKLDTSKASFWRRDEFPGSIINKNPVFIDPQNWDLRPDTLSPLIKNGNPTFSLLYPSDIRGVSRPMSDNPDIGAYERLPGEHKKIK